MSDSNNILQHPTICLPFFDSFVAYFAIGMIESMLEPHLIEAGATHNQVGLAFFICGLVFMVSAPIIGYVSNFN